MIVNRHHLTLEMEIVKWMLLTGLAIIAALALVTVLAAEPIVGPAVVDPMDEPALLPAEIDQLAKPMLPYPQAYFPEDELALDLPPAALAARVWTLLETQRAGLAREALAGWREIRLPGDADAWREVAMAAANMNRGNFERAARHLENARGYENAQAVVAYYTGVLRLEQAAAAAKAPEAPADGLMRMVAYGALEPADLLQPTQPPQGALGATILRVLARRQLEMAIARACEIRLDERLVMTEPGLEEEFVAPRVGDLLVAIGAVNFVGQAHHMLFALELDRGQLREAEDHLDQAVATGIAPLYGYGDLAEAYRALDEPADALRATEKDLASNYPLLWEAGREMKATLDRLWEGWVW